MKKITSSGGTLALLIFTTTFTGCLGMKTQGSLLSSVTLLSQSTPNSTPAEAFQTIPAGTAFTLSQPPAAVAVEMELNQSMELDYSLSVGAYSGTLSLQVQAGEIAAIDPKSAVKFTVIPSMMTVTPNTTRNFKVRIDVASLAPDFSLHFHLVAIESAGAIRKRAKIDRDFMVKPIFRVEYTAGNAVNSRSWTTDEVDQVSGIATKKSYSFIPHLPKLTLYFTNRDAVPHAIHGNGGIPHQGGESAPDESYTVEITDTQSNLQGSYYSHDAETGDKAGTLLFNVP
jgi:hypothetical protein